jgi:hypothetical protein
MGCQHKRERGRHRSAWEDLQTVVVDVEEVHFTVSRDKNTLFVYNRMCVIHLRILRMRPFVEPLWCSFRLSHECGRLRTKGTSLPTVRDAQSGNAMLLKGITKRLVRYALRVTRYGYALRVTRYALRKIGASSYSDYLLRTSQHAAWSVLTRIAFAHPYCIQLPWPRGAAYPHAHLHVYQTRTSARANDLETTHTLDERRIQDDFNRAEQQTHPETEPQPVLLGKLLVP